MNIFVLHISLLGFYCVFGTAEEQQQQEEEEAPEPRRLVTKSLVLNNGLPWGSWGEVEYCPDGSFAIDMEVKFKPYKLTETDETALNAVKLYCAVPDLHQTGYIMSTEGNQGHWQGMRVCDTGFLTGMRAQVLPPKGLIGDDVAVQNLQMECDYGPEVITGVEGNVKVGGYSLLPVTEKKIHEGEWSLWARCSNGSVICGIEIRYDSPTSALDDAAVSDISMFCCALDDREGR